MNKQIPGERMFKGMPTGLKDYCEGDVIEFGIVGTDTHIEIVEGIIKYSSKYAAFVIDSPKWKGLLCKKAGTTYDKKVIKKY